MSQEFATEEKFIGYRSKPDETNANPRILVAPSQNVIINDEEKVVVRAGYDRLGTANTNLNPPLNGFDWFDSQGITHNLRKIDTTLEVFIGTVEGRDFNDWNTVEDGLGAAVTFRAAPWWSTDLGFDTLLFVLQDDLIYEWGGGLTTFSASAATTLTKEGTGTWTAAKFLNGASFSGGQTTREVRILDSGGTWRTFVYTGGEGTTTLTGITPDPTAFTFAAGALIIQEVRSYNNEPADGLTNDLIKVIDNLTFIGDLSTKEVFVMSDTNFTDSSFSAPRTSGEGGLLVLGDRPQAFAALDGQMHISAGRDTWYRVGFLEITVSTTLAEIITVKEVKKGGEKGAQSQELVLELGDEIVYVSHEPALRSLGSLEELEGLQLRTLSDPIKPDFDSEDFTNGNIKFHREKILISAPVNSKIYILQFKEDEESGDITRFWQPPQILPVRNFMLRSGTLYGHSNVVSETYELFTGTNDEGLPMKAVARFSYRGFGNRANEKEFDEYYIEGYISANTVISTTIRYDFQGSSGIIEETIDILNNPDIKFEAEDSNILGDEGLGDGGLGIEFDAATTPKFRTILELEKTDNFEYQIEFSSDDVDQQWEILSHGPNVAVAPTESSFIKG